MVGGFRSEPGATWPGILEGSNWSRVTDRVTGLARDQFEAALNEAAGVGLRYGRSIDQGDLKGGFEAVRGGVMRKERWQQRRAGYCGRDRVRFGVNAGSGAVTLSLTG